MTPVIAVMMGMDLAQKQMAKLVSVSGPEQTALALWAGHGLHSASFAIFSISLILASVTPVLVGVAVTLGREYPTWIGMVFGCGRDRDSDHCGASGGEWPNACHAQCTVPCFRASGDYIHHNTEYTYLAKGSQAVALGEVIRFDGRLTNACS